MEDEAQLVDEIVRNLLGIFAVFLHNGQEPNCFDSKELPGLIRLVDGRAQHALAWVEMESKTRHVLEALVSAGTVTEADMKELGMVSPCRLLCRAFSHAGLNGRMWPRMGWTRPPRGASAGRALS